MKKLLFTILILALVVGKMYSQQIPFGFSHKKVTKIVCSGNSITFGIGAIPSKSYPQQLQDSLGTEYQVINYGHSGQATPYLLSIYKTESNNAYIGTAKSVCVIWEGTNDFYYLATSDSAYARLRQLCFLAKSTGYKVIIVTILPATYEGYPLDFGTKRTETNTLLRNNYLEFADAIADVGADTTMGQEGQQLNTTYYNDGLHLTANGYKIVCTYVFNAIKSLE